MKTASLLLLLSVDVVVSASLGHSDGLQKRQAGLSSITAKLGGGGGKVGDPPGASPKKVTLKSDSQIPGVKRIKIRSGPYKVPNMGKQSITGHAGMLESYYDSAIEKPCAGDCNILRQVGGLEYANGTNANIDSGMWLHHMVQFNSGVRRWDPVGYFSSFCLPFLGFGQRPTGSERYFVTGNERSVVNYHQGGSSMTSGTAYHLDASDKFTYLIELMNMNMEDRIVYITMTYDILDGPLPAGWQETKTIYLDAASCGTSEVKPPKQNGQFTIESKPWKPNVEGKIVYAMGHLHDGGVNIDVKANSSSSLCNSPAQYSEINDYVWRGAVMGQDKVAKDHISSMPGCSPKDFKVSQMKKDQSWMVRGSYDYEKKEGNLEKGKQSDIMAIAILLVAVPPGVRPS